MAQDNLDLGVLKKIKLTDRFYTHGLAGYSVIDMDLLSQHRGRVAVFYRASLQFSVEAIQHFRPNTISLHLATGGQRWYIVVCYLAPDHALTIYFIVIDIGERPHRSKLMVEVKFNANLTGLEQSEQEKEIGLALAAAVLEDMLAHFILRRHPWTWYRKTWSMVRLGREVRSWTDYILGTDHHLFRNTSVRDPIHKPDHYLILGCLCRATFREHSK